MCDFIIYFIVPFFMCALFMIGIMIYLRECNFKANGKRRKKARWRKLTRQQRSDEIKYHNTAVYKVYEFYIKIILAILSGVALVSLTTSRDPEITKYMIEIGVAALVIITIFFSVVVIGHQKAKIERWKLRYTWEKILIWNEVWFVCTSVSVAVYLKCICLPALIAIIESPRP